MQIKDLTDGLTGVDIDGMITKIGEERINQYGRVASLTLEDGGSAISLSLWNEEIDRAKIGMKIRVKKAKVTAFRGRLQLNTREKFEILDQSPPPPEERKKEPKPKLESYYAGIQELTEVDVVQANILLKEGWQLEGIKERHSATPDLNGNIISESAIVYIFSRRT